MLKDDNNEAVVGGCNIISWSMIVHNFHLISKETSVEFSFYIVVWFCCEWRRRRRRWWQPILDVVAKFELCAVVYEPDWPIVSVVKQVCCDRIFQSVNNNVGPPAQPSCKLDIYTHHNTKQMINSNRQIALLQSVNEVGIRTFSTNTNSNKMLHFSP